MIPGLDPRAIKKMMKQMGMDMEDIPAEEVIIKKQGGGEIRISRPQVQKMKVPGQGESYQVIGSSQEIGAEASQPEISDEDINLVAEQAKVPREKAKDALEKNNGDIAGSVIYLK